MIRKAFPIVALLLLLAAGFHSPARELSLPVQHLGVGEGLPQGSVYSLHQDKAGFIWVGTGDGLARWDGRSFHSFRGRHGDTGGHSLAARMIRGPMAEDASGGLWMTTSLGIAVYNQHTGRFRIIASQPGYTVERVAILGIDSAQRLYCLGRSQLYRINTSDGLVQSFPQTRSWSFGVLLRNGLYCTDSTGLFRLNNALSGTPELLLKLSGINNIFSSESGSLHIWTENSLYIRAPDGSIAKRPLPLGGQPPLYPRLLSGENSYYCVDRGGLLCWNMVTNAVERFATKTDPARSLSNTLIMTVMPDRSQNLWIGTEGTGLDVADMKGFKFASYPPGRAESKPEGLMVKSLLDVGGRLWIGTFDKGLFELDRNTGAASHWQGPGKGLHRTSLLYRDAEDRIWMNLEDRIGIADTLTKRFRISASIPEPDKGNLTAYAMLELAPGDYLLSSTYRLYRMQFRKAGLSIRPVAYGSGATTGIIAAIHRWSDGSIFIGKVRDGFYRLRLRENGEIAILDDGLHYTGIRDFIRSPDGLHLWMATENGLGYYDRATKVLKLLDESDGLSNSHIYGIVPEGDSALWVSTNKGLNRIIIRYGSGGSLASVSVRSYTAQDGLQSNEFNTGAFCRMADGAIAFGGVTGANWFYPAQFSINPHPPQVALTGISINERPLQSDTSYSCLRMLSLPYTDNTLAFQMAALEFTNPAANRYAYKLEGFDKDWVDGGARGEARYANLPPGSYFFLAKAANGDGVWSERPEALPIVIHPPWWGTLAARIAAFLLLVSLLALGVRLYIRRRVAARLRELEKQQAVNEERLRISRDMHDELGTGLTKIALLSQVAQRKTGSIASLGEITSTSRQLTQKISEIVWTLNPQNDTLDTLASYIREWVQEQYDALDNVFVRTDFEEQLPAISLSHSRRQALLLVTKEAVNNAVKYSGAGEIVVRMHLTADDIIFEVCDKGYGFKEGERSKGGSGNGLKNMTVRMTEANGNFSIKSKPGEGTTVRYSVPR